MYSKNLKELRKEDELTQQQLADAIGVSRNLFGKFENEYSIMSVEQLDLLCKYLNVSFDYIFDFTIKRRYPNSGEIKDKKLIGKRLKEAREELGLYQKDIAKKIGTSQSVITGYETGRYLISTTSLHNICKTYKISADWLLGKIDSPKFR